MKKSDFKLILTYLHRFIEPPVFSRQKAAAFGRYIAAAVSLVWEQINGLDYSMVYYTKDENIHNSVYTKAPRKVLKRIFDDLGDASGKSFIDVGCGKGYVITIAGKYPFEKAGDVEYTKQLYDICCRNLRKKKLSTKDIYHDDAKNFPHYGDFDVFFFNNPFDETILKSVAEKIWETTFGKTCYLYYLNPSDTKRTNVIEKAGFKLVKQIPDKNEWYFNINVYTNI